MHDATDHELQDAFTRLSGGDAAALEILWRCMARPLHNYAFAITGCQDEADDAVSEVLLKVSRAGRRLKRIRNARAYLFTAMRNACLTRRRRASALPHDPAATDNAAPEVDFAVRQAVMDLPVHQREAVVLHIWGGLTFREIAEVVRASPNTISSRYRYALDKLRKVLDDEAHE